MSSTKHSLSGSFCQWFSYWICINLFHVNSYYVSPHEFDYYEAQDFCINYCGSNLASIHSEAEYQLAIATIQEAQLIFNGYQEQDVYIGLQTIDDGFDITNTYWWHWEDGSNLDFGNTTAQYPWSGNQPDTFGAPCTTIWVTAGYRWDDVPCYGRKRALCQSCNGRINKYFIPSDSSLDYSSAKSKCESYGQTLASIHSDRDFNESKYLCSMDTKDTSYGCYIGLVKDSISSTYTWDDSTTFDYTKWSNIFGSGSYHAMATEDHYQWVATSGLAIGYGVCNMPNAFCRGPTWDILVEDQNNNAIIGVDCKAYLSGWDTVSLMSGLQWLR